MLHLGKSQYQIYSHNNLLTIFCKIIINTNATIGEKSNIPVLGNTFFIGTKMGSVIAYTTFKILFRIILSLTGIHDNMTLAKIAKY